MMHTFGISPYRANAHDGEMLRQVRASRLEKRLRESRVRRELLRSEDPKRGSEGPYEAVYADVGAPSSPGAPKVGREVPAQGMVVRSWRWGRGWWAW